MALAEPSARWRRESATLGPAKRDWVNSPAAVQGVWLATIEKIQALVLDAGIGGIRYKAPRSFDGVACHDPNLSKPSLGKPSLDKPSLGKPSLGKPSPSKPSLVRHGYI